MTVRAPKADTPYDPKRDISDSGTAALLASVSRLMSEWSDPCTLSLNSRRAGPAQRFFEWSPAPARRAEDRLIERLHPVLRGARRDRRGLGASSSLSTMQSRMRAC